VAASVLYFDLGSPYAHLAFARAQSVFDRMPEPMPVLLGALFARLAFQAGVRRRSARAGGAAGQELGHPLKAQLQPRERRGIGDAQVVVGVVAERGAGERPPPSRLDEQRSASSRRSAPCRTRSGNA